MFDLSETLTPLVQRNSIDEGYLDLGPCGFGSTPEIASRLRLLQRRIWDELQIPVSLGLATNKLVAQIASKLRKPQGFVVVPAGTEAEFMAPLSIGKIPGVGPKTEAVLADRHGIRFVRDVLAKSEPELRRIFGDGWSGMLAMARGGDDRPVETGRDDPKSYSQQETFGRDIMDFAEIERIAKGMIDALMSKVRVDGKRVRTMTVKIRYPDFVQASQGRSLAAAADLEEPFYPLLAPLLRGAWRKRRPLRLVSVRLSGVDDVGTQLEMFGQAEEKGGGPAQSPGPRGDRATRAPACQTAGSFIIRPARLCRSTSSTARTITRSTSSTPRRLPKGKACPAARTIRSIA
jgi:DNA polymerase-4